MLFSNDDPILLQPIAQEQFCGRYLKANQAIFRPLRNAFNVAQTSLRKLSQNPDGRELEKLQSENLENWEALSNQLMDVFKTSSRDVELIGWFLSAQLQLDPSLNSFTQTLGWLLRLVEAHWDELHPVLPVDRLKSEDEQGRKTEQAEAKNKAFLQWLGNSEESSLLYSPILALSIVPGITFFQYKSAECKGDLRILKKQAILVSSQELYEIQNKLDNIFNSIKTLEKIEFLTFSNSKLLGVIEPNFKFLKSLLNKLQNAILYLTGIKDTSSVKEANCITSDASLITESINNIALSETNKGTESLLSADDVYHVSTASDMSKIMQVNTFNRDSAFHQLREISDYFRRSEPHSPVSFLLEKAIRWGYLSLPELLQEMISRDERISLDKVFNVIGLDHYEQVLLPDVSQHNVGIQQSSISVGTIGEAKVQTVEAKTAEVSSSDVPFNQKSEKDKPSGSTALRW
ncbi:ImpA family type VI secretion system protein [Vibrio cholerae]|uniref:type VI secretion system protein TssA n=6 Tax=Vibrio cholerae TaxID=666 RepID=UPI0004E42BC3|nr:type VI secretion system ImpA family N-terminal domain-containing protein [Vibrio cholerae]EGR2415747.1 type VI secretion protein [Vibrio cholerae]EGR2475267.1 type VI secretion protein [Vibrio cholerae]KFD83068.1 hypothetical protein DN41_3149 [Vibrio cholerae]MDV2309239.1 type VI secretion system ImpA family N-terminal domain-containing protein [Vibrio cholerae]CAB1242887.1 Uncharacterized protein ImpA [Vibrio cholerae]